MLGVVCHGQKDVRVEELAERPLGADEVRVCGAVGDFRVREPMVLGHEVSIELIVSGDRSKVVKLHLALNS